MDSKPVYLSKTFWMSAVVALAPLFPGVAAFVSAQPEMVGVILGVIFAALRYISKDKIVIL